MEKSYVVTINEGMGTNYYACMQCGEKSYININEKAYCERVNFINEKQAPTCEIISSTQSDEGMAFTINAKDENGHIKSIYLKTDDGVEEQLTNDEISNKEKEYEKTIVITKYGDNRVYALDDNYNRVQCIYLNYEKPTTTEIKEEIYFVSKDDYELHKDTGFTTEKLKTLEKYNGDTWKSGYAYVNLKYYKSQFKSIKVGSKEITDKYFFITDEGEITTEVIAVNINDEEIKLPITTRLDRTIPNSLSITNSSGEDWTKNSVTINATATDQHSGIESFKYTTDSSKWTSKIASNGKMSETWSNTVDRNLTLKIIAIDKAGNESTVKTTPIKIDVTPPYYSTKYTKGWGYTVNNNYCYTYDYHFKDASSGVYYLKYGHCYRNACSTSSAQSKCKAKSYELRNWEEGGYKAINYCVSGPRTAEIYFSVCDYVKNCAEFGPYIDSIPG